MIDSPGYDLLLTPVERIDSAAGRTPGNKQKHVNGCHSKRRRVECEKKSDAVNGSRPFGSPLTPDYVSSADSADKYKRLKMVGKGQYGHVYKAENVVTREIVACKVASKHEDPVLQGFPISLIREISVMRLLKHESICRMIEVVVANNGLPIIVMEYCQASLLELLQSEQHGLMMGEVKFITRQILDGVCYMHRLGVLHRDLATKNILFNQSGEIKVCDFGISRIGFIHDPEIGFLPAPDLEPPHLCVSLHYRSIELCLGEKEYGPALDVWSVGCILAEIVISQAGRRQPFFGGVRENPNKTPQMIVTTVMEILGRPTEASWPGVTKLPQCNIISDIKQYQAHKEPKEEKTFLANYFTQGEGKPCMAKYMLTDTSFELLADLLRMCPSDRISARDALQSSFFKEKPLPEWHAWHWATSVCQIDQRKEVRDSKETLKRQLLEHEKEQKKAAITTNLKRDAKAKADLEDGLLKAGWSKKWSNSRKRYYYYHAKTMATQWEVPTA